MATAKDKAWARLVAMRVPAAQLPTVMPFGQHRGEQIADLPLPYLSWLLGRCIDGMVGEAIKVEAADRLLRANGHETEYV